MPVPIYSHRPATKLEASAYAAIVAILIAVFAYEVLYYMEAAERTSVDATVNRITAAATARLAYHVMTRGTAADISAWKQQSPFAVAGMSPDNFVGEIDSSRPDALEGGSWGYDRARSELIYRPRLRLRLSTADVQGLLRFRAVIATDPFAYRLLPAVPYEWG